MAAVIAVPHRRTVHAPELSPLTGPGSGRPSLQVIPGGRRGVRDHARSQRPVGRLHPAVYQRRRLGVLVAAVTIVVVGYLALTGLGALLSPHSAGAVAAGASADAGASAAPVAPAAPSAAPAAYVVQPGDTLWSIARHLRPSGDIRPLVDALADRAGPGPLEAGESLPVDGLVD
ncbi:MAG: LysM peptidoglycan-binding domain-containing protein [Acidimicrobiales bacterium]